MFLAGQRMLAERIHVDAAGAGVSLAECPTQSETEVHSFGVVIGSTCVEPITILAL